MESPSLAPGAMGHIDALRSSHPAFYSYSVYSYPRRADITASRPSRGARRWLSTFPALRTRISAYDPGLRPELPRSCVQKAPLKRISRISCDSSGDSSQYTSQDAVSAAQAATFSQVVATRWQGGDGQACDATPQIVISKVKGASKELVAWCQPGPEIVISKLSSVTKEVVASGKAGGVMSTERERTEFGFLQDPGKLTQGDKSSKSAALGVPQSEPAGESGRQKAENVAESGSASWFSSKTSRSNLGEFEKTQVTVQDKRLRAAISKNGGFTSPANAQSAAPGGPLPFPALLTSSEAASFLALESLGAPEAHQATESQPGVDGNASSASSAGVAERLRGASASDAPEAEASREDQRHNGKEGTEPSATALEAEDIIGSNGTQLKTGIGSSQGTPSVSKVREALSFSSQKAHQGQQGQSGPVRELGPSEAGLASEIALVVSAEVDAFESPEDDALSPTALDMLRQVSSGSGAEGQRRNAEASSAGACGDKSGEKNGGRATSDSAAQAQAAELSARTRSAVVAVCALLSRLTERVLRTLKELQSRASESIEGGVKEDAESGEALPLPPKLQALLDRIAQEGTGGLHLVQRRISSYLPSSSSSSSTSSAAATKSSSPVASSTQTVAATVQGQGQGQALVLPVQTQLISLLFLLVPAALCSLLRLGLSKGLLLAGLRSYLQLLAIGFGLRFIFDMESMYPIFIYVSGMVLVAGHTAAQRAKGVPNAMAVATVCIMGAATLALTASVRLGVLPLRPRFVIPIAGIVVGSTMTIAANTMQRLADDMTSFRGQVEAALALGASPYQACHHLVRRAIEVGVGPSIDYTKTIGLIQLPGTMTGMIMGGASVSEAISLQIVVTMVLLGTCTLSCILSAVLSAPQFFSGGSMKDFV